MPRAVSKKKPTKAKKKAAVKKRVSARPVRHLKVAPAHAPQKQSVAEEMITKLRLSKHVSHPDETFWVNNGPVCQTITELKNAIAEMTDDQFEYHTKRNGNDFARWLEEAMCHDECARKITKARTRAAAIRALAICDDN